MDYIEISKNIRKNILEMAFNAQAGHIASSLSLADILTVLYFNILKIDPKNYLDENRDRFVLSKGHAAMALYSALAERGFFLKEALANYGKDACKMPGHSTKQSVEGAEVSTGSLGHGLPMAAGMALAGKRDKKDYRVFIVMGDGETQEGTTWEAALFAAHHKLDNLILIIDYNKLQLFGRTNDVLNLEPLAEKWKSFGWSVKETDGHNCAEIEKILSKVPFEEGKPSVVIAHTLKGAGVSFMEGKIEWHDKKLSREDYEASIKGL